MFLLSGSNSDKNVAGNSSIISNQVQSTQKHLKYPRKDFELHQLAFVLTQPITGTGAEGLY